MKILHLISGGDKGGAKTHMFALLDQLCKLADVTVVCVIPGVFYQEILERDVNTVLLEQKSRFDYSIVDKLAKMINDDGYDIVNAHGARANNIAAKLKKKINVPICTTIHSDYLLDFDTFYKKIFFTALNKNALNKLHYKIAVSNAFRNMLIERGFLPNDILTVYNGMDFDTPYTAISREEFAAKYNLPLSQGIKYIGIAARFDYVKGVDVFIRACAVCHSLAPNTHFVIAGEGAEEENLKALAKELGIEDVCHFVGFVSPIYDFLNFIDVNSLTSRSESFPYSILEGAKAHKPTVAARVGGIPDLICDNDTGFLFDAEDYEACGQAFARMATEPNMATQLGENLYIKASTQFSNLALAKKYLANYQSFIEKYNRQKRYDVVLSGYYGFDNYGDEAMLYTIVEKIKEDKPNCEICILSKNPDKTRLEYGVDSFNRYSLHDLRSTIKNSKTYVNGGGTLLCDITSSRSIMYYSYLLRYAHNHGLKTMIMANGIGPFRRKKNVNVAKKALENTDVITMRDKASYDISHKLLPNKEQIYQTTDIALLNDYESCPTLSDSFAIKYDLKKDNYIVVSIRDSKNLSNASLHKIVKVLNHLVKKTGIKVILLPLQYSKDSNISNFVSKKIGSKACVIDAMDISSEAIVSIIANAKCVVAMRLHALIYSTICNRPMVALSYDKKVTNYMRENKLGPCIDVRSFTSDQLYTAINDVLNTPFDCSDTRVMLREKSKQNITELIKLL